MLLTVFLYFPQFYIVIFTGSQADHELNIISLPNLSLAQARKKATIPKILIFSTERKEETIPSFAQARKKATIPKILIFSTERKKETIPTSL